VAKIYISSTYEDLKEYRETVYRALRKMSHDVIAMEDYVATDKRPLQKCLEDVVSCDIYIGVFAWRYGFVPEDEKDNPYRLSITELEYRKAKEKGMPCLIFLLNREDWPLKFSDGTAQSEIKSAENINRLRNKLSKEYLTSFFKDHEELTGLIVIAVNKILPRPNLEPYQPLRIMLFKGEKTFFVGREEYINKIREEIKIPSSRVCIVGPGGSGKSQLAFKAIHQYEKEGLFDLVIPVYFSDVTKMTFSDFLLDIAKVLDIDIREFEKLDIENRKNRIYRYLFQRKSPSLLYLDNYESISYLLNYNNSENDKQQSKENAINISYFLNNNLPTNVSILVSSRERNNRFGNKEVRIFLEGLNKQECIDLFSGLTSEDYLKDIKNIMNNPTAKAAIDKICEMTGGHPLSIEIIAKNTSNIYEINQMANTLGLGIVNTDEPEKRLRSLESCFDYTINRLPEEIKNLLYYLTIFKSPFPIYVAKEVLNEDARSIIELHNRGLLLQIKSENSFGEINNPE
jgi:GTPase SAR1 family protein